MDAKERVVRRDQAQRLRLTGVVALVVIALSIVAAGCGSSSSSSSAAAPSSTNASAGTTSSVVAQAKQFIETAYTGNLQQPPASGPKAQKGKIVWILACSLQAVGCSSTANAAGDAAKKLGWNYRLVDGKFTPSVYNQVIRQATAAKVDGLITIGVNCTDAPAAIKAAVAAGVKVVNEGGSDCAQKEFTGTVLWSGGKTQVQMLATDIGKVRADWIIANTDGKANVLYVRLMDNAIAEGYVKGVMGELARCSHCKVASVPVTTPDYATGKVQGKVATALVQHPQANVVISAFDALHEAGVAAAMKTSGRKLLTVGNDGEDVMVNLMRQGQVQATPVLFLGWSGYAAADTLNRAFAGQPAAASGDGYQLVDPTHRMPPAGVSILSTGPTGVTWKADYLKVWGVNG
jgi:ribose transport system substrate-binding protein